MSRPKFTIQSTGARWRKYFCIVIGITIWSAMPQPGLCQTIDVLRSDLAKKEAELGTDHLDVAENLARLASRLYTHADYAEAEPLYKRCLAIREQRLGQNHPLVAQTLNDLGALYRAQGRYGEAELLFQRSLAIREKTLGAKHPDTATTLNNLGRVYHDQGRFADAEALYRRSLAVREETLGPMHPDVAFSLHNIGTLYWERGRFAEAEPIYKRSLAIREKALRPDDPELARSLNNLALLYWNQGRYAEAEPMYQRSLAIREKALGPDHPDVAISLNNLALLYYSQGRFPEAEIFYKRCAAIAEKTLGPSHITFAQAIANLARVYADQGRYADAEPLYRRSLAIREQALGSEHPDVAINLNALGLLYEGQGRYADAEPLFRRSLAIRERAFGAGHPYVGQSLNNLARLYFAVGRYAEAEPLYLRGLAIREELLGSAHPDVAISLDNLARLYGAQNRLDVALTYSRRAFQLLRKRFAQGADQGAGQLAEQRNKRSYFTGHIGLLARSSPRDTAEDTSESFEAAQLAQASSVGQSVAQMAARFAAQGGALASAIRDRQDTADSLARADKALIEAIGAPQRNGASGSEIAALRVRLAELTDALADKTRGISSRFPEYDALVSTAPVSLADARRLLHPEEALIVYLVDRGGVFVWAVRQDGTEFKRLAISEEELKRTVAGLRELLDPEQNPDSIPYDTATALGLYQKILAPIEPALKGATHLIMVSDGDLQSLPPSVLVSKIDNGKPEWLADRYAFSIVPSVSALRALRAFSGNKTATEPFVGFGDPILGNSVGDKRRLSARALFGHGAVEGGRLGIANVDVIREASPLPETADELRAIAATLHAPVESVYLRQRATEAQIKAMDLSRYRILAFATHGVMAGELSGLAEPGLVLTPPAEGSETDDGYLAASEVAQLKLDADWVVLSACNTSAPDGSPGAEGLSGLAKAFFYAGARSLLVSSWYVFSDTTVQLTTEMLKSYQEDPAVGRAEALKRSMEKLRRNPQFAHPMFWAPFIVVGEGRR